MNDKVVVLIPCFNEESTIRQVIKDFKSALPQAIIYVYDNNSTDNTAEIANQCHVEVIPEPEQGKGAVVKSMFADIDADIYLMVDGDSTYSAAYADQLVELIKNGYDMAIGDRLSNDHNNRVFHGFGNKLVNFLVNKKFKSNLPDIMTGYRAFNKKFVKEFIPKTKGFEIETEMSIFAINNNMKVGSVPVTYEDRPVGSTSKLRTISDGFKIISYIFRQKRIK